MRFARINSAERGKHGLVGAQIGLPHKFMHDVARIARDFCDEDTPILHPGGGLGPIFRLSAFLLVLVPRRINAISAAHEEIQPRASKPARNANHNLLSSAPLKP